jgi:hypothetical protein
VSILSMGYGIARVSIAPASLAVKTDVFPSTIRLPDPSNLGLVLLRILNTEEAVEVPA